MQSLLPLGLCAGLLLSITACTTSHATANPTPRATSTATPLQAATARAHSLLAEAIIPEGAHWVQKAPKSAPTEPFEVIGCRPIVDLPRFAVMQGITLPLATAALMSAIPSGGAGHEQNTLKGRLESTGVIEQSPGRNDALTVTLVANQSGGVILRADAVTVPSNAACFSFGVSSGASSA